MCVDKKFHAREFHPILQRVVCKTYTLVVNCMDMNLELAQRAHKEANMRNGSVARFSASLLIKWIL